MQKSPPARSHGLEHHSLTAHLQPSHVPIIVEEYWPAFVQILGTKKPKTGSKWAFVTSWVPRATYGFGWSGTKWGKVLMEWLWIWENMGGSARPRCASAL